MKFLDFLLRRNDKPTADVKVTCLETKEVFDLHDVATVISTRTGDELSAVVAALRSSSENNVTMYGLHWKVQE